MPAPGAATRTRARCVLAKRPRSAARPTDASGWQVHERALYFNGSHGRPADDEGRLPTDEQDPTQRDGAASNNTERSTVAAPPVDAH
eukprot:4043707-Alexandrium_andersonii.AAC.1